MNSSFSSISFDAEIVKRFKQYAIKADLTHTGLLRYCLDCSNVYEIVERIDIIYYPEFPTYGLQRETCCNCRGGN